MGPNENQDNQYTLPSQEPAGLIEGEGGVKFRVYRSNRRNMRGMAIFLIMRDGNITDLGGISVMIQMESRKRFGA